MCLLCTWEDWSAKREPPGQGETEASPRSRPLSCELQAPGYTLHRPPDSPAQPGEQSHLKARRPQQAQWACRWCCTMASRALHSLIGLTGLLPSSALSHFPLMGPAHFLHHCKPQPAFSLLPSVKDRHPTLTFCHLTVVGKDLWKYQTATKITVFRWAFFFHL